MKFWLGFIFMAIILFGVVVVGFDFLVHGHPWYAMLSVVVTLILANILPRPIAALIMWSENE